MYYEWHCNGGFEWFVELVNGFELNGLWKIDWMCVLYWMEGSRVLNWIGAIWTWSYGIMLMFMDAILWIVNWNEE